MITIEQVLEIINQYDLEKTLWRRAMDSIWGGHSRSTAMTAVANFMDSINSINHMGHLIDLSPDPDHLDLTRFRPTEEADLKALVQQHRQNGGAATQRALTALEKALEEGLSFRPWDLTITRVEIPQAVLPPARNGCIVVSTMSCSQEASKLHETLPPALSMGRPPRIDPGLATTTVNLRLIEGAALDQHLANKHALSLKPERTTTFFGSTQAAARHALATSSSRHVASESVVPSAPQLTS